MKRFITTALATIVAVYGHSQTNTFPADGYVGIGTTSPAHKLYISGGHNDSRMVLNYSHPNPAYHADLTLWASEPGMTYSGTGIGNNVINSEVWPYIQRINTLKGGSYIRLLDQELKFNIVQSSGVDLSAMTINSNGNIGISTSSPIGKLDIRTNPSQLTGLSISPEGNNHSYLMIDRKTGFDGGILWNRDGSHVWQQINNDNGDMSWYSYNGGGTVLTFNKYGYVGIGTTDTKGYKLAVAGNMIAESVKVALQGTWPDYVFKPGNKLRSLKELENYVQLNNHLPEMPSEAEVKKDGIDLGQMDAKLLKKIEELTLYMIEQNKVSVDLRKTIQLQNERIESLEKQTVK